MLTVYLCIRSIEIWSVMGCGNELEIYLLEIGALKESPVFVWSLWSYRWEKNPWSIKQCRTDWNLCQLQWLGEGFQGNQFVSAQSKSPHKTRRKQKTPSKLLLLKPPQILNPRNINKTPPSFSQWFGFFHLFKMSCPKTMISKAGKIFLQHYKNSYSNPCSTMGKMFH